MPWGLKRYQYTGTPHFITFSCYRRQPLLMKHGAAQMFEQAPEEARVKYGFFVFGYVVMLEHVHLLVSEPERGTLATATGKVPSSFTPTKRPTQSKEGCVGTQDSGGTQHFWQTRYHDFNVRTPAKRVEKLASGDPVGV